MVSNISNDLNLRNTNLTQTGITPVNFRANSTNSLERTPEKDTIETKKEEKKGLSKAAKWGLGITGFFAAIGTTALLISRHQLGKVKQLFKDKLVLSNLPEKIEFKEAKSVEEGLKFAREVLGIKEIKGFSEFDPKGALEAINFANKGIVDVANANKGKIFLPRRLTLEKMESRTTLASANLAIKTDQFGELTINSTHFSHEGLDSILRERYDLVKKAADVSTGTTEKTASKSKARNIKLGIIWSKRYKDLLNKYIKNQSSLSLAEKRELMGIYGTSADFYNNLVHYNPLTILELNLENFKKLGLKYDLEALKKLSLEEQCAKLDDICLQFEKKTGTIPGIRSCEDLPYSTIWHEMGHLQDYATNLEKMHIQNSEWTKFKNIFKKPLSTDVKTEMKEYEKFLEADHLVNRWIKKGDIKKLLKENPDKVKKMMPDFYEHITNPEIQKTAGKVSSYAREGIGEFVAEVYAGLIEGRKFSDDVIALYKKYNGPLLPGM